MRVSRSRIMLRRAAALVVAIAATAAIALLVFRSVGGGHGGEVRIPSGVSGASRKVVKRMSLAEKVDQVLALGFAGTDSTAPVLEKLRHRQIGGIFVGSQNWIDAAQGKALIGALKDAAKSGGDVPPLMIARQGGGDDRAFADLPPQQGEEALGALDDPEKARVWALDAGRALRQVGIDLNIGIDADVASAGSAVSGHTFSTNPSIVASMTVAAMIGCAQARIGCAVAHFPGLGGTTGDTDVGPASVGEDPGTLRRRDVPPFQAAIRARVPVVVLSQAFYAAYNPIKPASQTPAIATALLRGGLGFRGLAMTDNEAAGAIKAVGPVSDAAVASLRGGADLVLIESPGAVQARARRAIIAAARDRELPLSRLNEAAGRVVELKRTLGLL